MLSFSVYILSLSTCLLSVYSLSPILQSLCTLLHNLIRLTYKDENVEELDKFIKRKKCNSFHAYHVRSKTKVLQSKENFRNASSPFSPISSV